MVPQTARAGGALQEEGASVWRPAAGETSGEAERERPAHSTISGENCRRPVGVIVYYITTLAKNKNLIQTLSMRILDPHPKIIIPKLR